MPEVQVGHLEVIVRVRTTEGVYFPINWKLIMPELGKIDGSQCYISDCRNHPTGHHTCWITSAECI